MTERWLYAWGLGSVAFGGASLLVPLYIVQLGATPVELGILAATAAGIGAPGAILFGRLANTVGHRRPLVVVTLAAVAVALAAIPLLSTVTTVIVANAMLWLVVASIAPVLTMLVVDEAPESAWNERIGLLNKFQGYGWAGGLVLGTVWPFVGQQLLAPDDVTRVLFWLLAACGATSALAAARTLPRPAPDEHVTGRRATRRIGRLVSSSRRGVRGATFAFSPNRLYWATRDIDLGRLVGRFDRSLATYFVAALFFLTGSAAFWAPLPLFLTEAGFNSGQVFALYLASSIGAAVLYEGAGRLSSRYDPRLLQTGALTVRGALFPAVAVVTGLGALALELGVALAALAVVGLTWAVIAVVGTSIVTRLAPPSVRGEVLGIYVALGAVAGGVGGVLGGWVATFGYLVAFGVAGGFVFVGAALVVSLRALSGGKRATETNAEPAAPPNPGDVPAVTGQELSEPDP